ncbi:MAG: HAD-IG family 5'-nucleotidase [Myxococcota bacterium]
MVRSVATQDAGAGAALLDALYASELRAPLETARQVFVNRDLRLDTVKGVGFDMDYTLAIYKRVPMEELQYKLTIEKLINKRGYPAEIANIPYDPTFVIRGLVVDRLRGNILKMDAHGHVGRVFHGRRKLPREERKEVYRTVSVRLSKNKHYASLDTLFSMPEACLYANLVDHFEARHAAGRGVEPLHPPPPVEGEAPNGPPPVMDYDKLFVDVRECIDEAHRDDSLKSIIKRDLAQYILKDPELPLTLHKLRSSGKKLYLITNSLWDYTSHVMSFLLEAGLHEYPSWRQFFDVVVVGSSKPRFFTEQNPFLEVDVVTGLPRPNHLPERFERGHVYQGGNIHEFERRTGLRGDEILYVGDHIYGDIMRSKKDNLWRTALVVQELEEEIQTVETHRARLWALADLDRKRYALDDAVSQQKALLARIEQDMAAGGSGLVQNAEPAAVEAATRQLRRQLDDDKRALKAVATQAQEIEAEVANAINPHWGMVFKEAHELSRFGEQVEDYACIYTSRVSNLLYYSPMHYFRAPRIQMHHEQVALSGARKAP